MSNPRQRRIMIVTPSASFTPSVSQTPLPIQPTAQPGRELNLPLIIGLSVGIGVFVIALVVIFILVAKCKGWFNPRVYASAHSNKTPPTLAYKCTNATYSVA